MTRRPSRRPSRRTTTRPGLRRAGLLAAVVVALVGLSACEPYVRWPISGPLGPVGPESSAIGCDRAAEPLVLTTSSHLDPACTYTGGVSITASSVTLDCRGARIEDPTGTRSRGIHIHAPADVALTDVTVRNCVVVGFLNNVRVSRDGFQSLPAGGEYEHPFERIVVERSHLYASRGSGVFVNAYVTGVTLRELDIAGSGSVGIYLEAGSTGSTVERNTVHDNGFGDVTAEGIPFTVGSLEFRYLGTGREGIAIDGSRDNVVRANRLARNSAGGIFLYKNCGEYATEKPAQWWERRYGADGNLIERNTITDERNGVWVGSRMAENQVFMDCSDPAYVDTSLKRVHGDRAADDVVRDNAFERVTYGVRVEDDRATVTGNTFVGDDPAAQAVVIGTKERTAVLGEPVSGTVVTGNVAQLAGVPYPYRWIHGHTGTTFAGNTSLGATVTLRQGLQPPIDPFLFVRSYWQV